MGRRFLIWGFIVASGCRAGYSAQAHDAGADDAGADDAGPNAGCFGPVLGGLVGWWGLDDGAGKTATDASGNGHDGTLVDDPVWIAGRVGGALDFDGLLARVDLGSDDEVGLRIPVTLTAWIRPRKTEDVHSILGRDDGDGFRQFQWRISEERTPYFTLYPDCDSDGQLALKADDPIAIDGLWTHVAMTIDASATVTHYINGAPSGTLDLPRATICPSAASTYLGGTPFSLDAYMWDGAIDEVRVYDRALQSCELTAVHCHGDWHCDNGVQDCGETGVDTGGDCG